MAKTYHPFEPIIDNSSKILILGTFPSIDSFKNTFYYGNRFNQFWKLISAVFEEEEPKSIEEKLKFLKKHHIALWDVVKECFRINSSDKNLKDIKVNDIRSLIKKYPNIKAIFFTSRLAQKIYNQHFSDIKLPTYYLPSPSPAYQKIGFSDKLKEWKRLIKLYYEDSAKEEKKSS